MEFSEAHYSWRAIPDWVSFLIAFGYCWLHDRVDTRRVAVISMPSDSAAAGLVALGSMRKCLELQDATDVGAHYKRLLEFARKGDSAVELRHTKYPGVWAFDGHNQAGQPMVKKLRDKSRRRVNIPFESALSWRINDEPPVALVPGKQVPNAEIYRNLFPSGGEIGSANLSESHSSVCLAGRGDGESPTKGSMEAIRFREGGATAYLSQLLTVQHWMPRTISRVLFYNSRTESFDRRVGTPQVVIADGDTAFLKVVDGTDFQESDVIGIVHRTMERSKLEAVGTKLVSLRQWYDEVALDGLPQTPRGISISVLRRRNECQ